MLTERSDQTELPTGTDQAVRDTDWRAQYLSWYEQTESACARLGHTLGFNPVILSSVRAFVTKPRILVMGLNPAGSRDYPEHRGRFRYEERDAYLGTSWDSYAAGQAPLQRQVAQLLRHLQRRVPASGPLELFALNRVVAGSLIPFRSRGEADLHNRQASLEFGKNIWRGILQLWRPQYAVCFGNTPFNELSALFGRSMEAREYDPRWQGALRVRVFSNGTRLLGVPHMSRFPIFGRAQSETAIGQAFDDLFALAP